MHLTPELHRRLRQTLSDRGTPFAWQPAFVVAVIEIPLIAVSLAVAVLHLPIVSSLALLVVLGLVNAVAVMTIGHDGQHRQWFRSKLISAVTVQISGFGLSRPWWHAKHNQFHHSGAPGGKYHEPPLDLGRVTRLAPDQPWRPWHRGQVVYFWPILLTQHTAMIWQSTVFSITGNFRGQQYGERNVRAVLRRLAEQWAFPGGLIALGALRHGIGAALCGALILSSVIGLVTALVLVVEIRCRALAATGDSHDGTVDGRHEWAAYQLAASMTINRSSRALTWLTGSLNLHTAHHLFPSLPSYRMPDVDDALRAITLEQGLVLNEYVTYRESWRSFAAFLVDLGRRPMTSGELK